jgi:hypothetical protein
MNLVGHLEVAARCGLGEAGQLGAILPDIASMLRVRVDRDALAGLADGADVVAGVAVHHATDAAFHDHVVVRGSMAAINVSLAERGVARGAARSAAHVGYEMLLDAVADDRLPAVMRSADDDLVRAALGAPDRWPELRDYFAHRVACHDDPEWVAERLYAVLRHRPRLAFPQGQVLAVAAVLSEHAPAIRANAPAIFDDVTSATARSTRSQARR